MDCVKSAINVVICFGFFSVYQANDEKYKSFDEICGGLNSWPETNGRFAWVATLHMKNETGDPTSAPAVILSPSLLAINAKSFNEKGKIVFHNFLTYSATANFTRIGENEENPYTQTVDITHIRLHPNPDSDLAFVHLKTPLRFDSQVHALCIPTTENVQEVLSLSSNASEISVLLIDWRHKEEILHHRLNVKNDERCRNWWKHSNSNESIEANYTGRFCANISKNYANTHCVHKEDLADSVAVGIVGKVNASEQHYFLGFVNNFTSANRTCSPEMIIYVRKPTELDRKTIHDQISCGPKSFTCDNGHCVSLDSICNKKINCKDGSDESLVYCDAVLNRTCDTDQYQCAADGNCISMANKCDGEGNCPGGDDETNCANEMPGYTIAGIIIGVFLFITLLGLSTYLLRKLKFAWEDAGDLTDEQVEDFHNGLKINILNNQRVNSQRSNGSGNMSCPPFLPFPSTSNFEIPREKLKIEWQKVLGKGKFSIVYKAVYDCGDSCYDVAVKTFKTSGPCGCKSAFMSQLTELKIMSQTGPHDNIVNLVGAYTKEIKKRILYIVVELCQLGNLHAYLTQNRERFVDVIDRDGTFNPFKSQRLKRNVGTQYENIVQTTHPDKSFTTLDLLLWAYQIASAMDYLVANKVTHGDLAAKKILLADNYNAKISDFGLSSELFKTGAYKKHLKKTPLPFRWMATESIQDCIVSSQSDIWSYGVTIWEIFTLGKLPYSGISQENICDELVQKGTRLEEPDFASTEIYAKMMECWNIQPEERPSFSSLKTYFQGLYQCLDYVIIPYL